MQFTNKVGVKLMAVNLFSLLFALVGMLVVIQYLATRQILQWHQQRVEMVARLVLAEYQGKNQRVVQAADFLANNPNYGELLAAGDFETLGRLITPQMKEVGLQILTVTDRRGVIVVRAHSPRAIGVDISGNPLVRAALKGKRASRMTQWKDSVALSATAPVMVGEEVVGVVLAGMLVDKGFVESLSREPGAEVAVFYSNNPIVNSFVDIPEGALKGLELGKGWAAVTVPGISRTQSAQLGNKTYTLTYLPLEGEDKPWENLIVVGISHREVTQAENALHMVIFGVGGGSILVGAFLSFLLSLGMRRQIAALAEGTRQATAAELTGDIPVTSTDELGELAVSFNTMTRALAEKTRMLQEERDRIAANADFLSMIVHDIKAPLTGVRLTIETLQDESLPADMNYKLQGIIESSEALLLHLHNVLDISRFESGQLTLKPEGLVPGFIVQRIVAHYRPLAQRQEVELTGEAAPDLPLVWADERYLERILFNLLSNALEASSRGGRIRVAAGPGSLDGGVPGVELMVADTAGGIEPEELAHLFEKYSGQGRADLNRAGGSGLGLYICKTLVEAHHGRIWAQTYPGQGTSIHLVLPLEPPGNGEAPETPAD